MLSAILRSITLVRVLPKANCEINTTGKHNGLGESYIWADSLDNGLKLAKNTQKPVMLIIHKSWCKACMNFKPKFAASEDIQTLSSYFVMVNVMDDEEPRDSQFAPDGTYIPRNVTSYTALSRDLYQILMHEKGISDRILFIAPSGRVLKDVRNDARKEDKFYFKEAQHVVKSMEKITQNYNYYKKQ